MMIEQQYTNYAFISYKREDEKWAKWLQHKLENYKLPSVIRKESSHSSKYIRPVFRDGTDLSGGVLIERLHEELMRSKFLIVICSPNTTKSEWVNKEAQTFIDDGRLENIIPFIVAGTPHAQDASEECFPKALLDIPAEKELLGINVQEVGRNMAFVRLVATMLNVRFDTLWRRHRRNQLRNMAVAAAVAVLAILAGVFVWDYNRATYSYYADYVDCWGVPQGVVPLTEQQVAKRERSYQFEYRRIPFDEPNAYSWRLAKVSYVNSALRPQEYIDSELRDRFPVQEIEYNKTNGVISRINYYDAYGKILLRHVLSEHDGVPATVADFVNAQEQKGAGFIAADLTSISMNAQEISQKAKSSIVRFVYERNASGYIVRKTYHSNNDYQLSRSAVCDADGIFGCSYTLDSLGRRIKVTYLDINGTQTQTRNGIAGKVYEYGKNGAVCKTTYVDMNGNPTLNELLWATLIEKTDENGNVIEDTFYDSEGKPTLIIMGFAKATAKYDEHGNQIEEVYYDTEGKPCFSGYGFARMTMKYDERGNRIEEAYYDIEGKPHERFGDGVVRMNVKYDERGHIIEVAFYNAEGKPCLNQAGYARWVDKYDERGNRVEEAYYDTEGKPCFCVDGYTRAVAKYDERGNRVEEAYYDAEGKLCFCGVGFARSVAKYDERGNRIELSFYDTEGKLCLNKNGYAQKKAEYDTKGNVIENAYYDTRGNLCLVGDGVARVVMKYDEQGYLIENIYYDDKGNVVKEVRADQ